MAKTMEVVEVEIDGPQNEHLYFAPLQRRLRGRFNLSRVKEPQAAMKTNNWPASIPGKRIGVNLDTGEGYIVEGIYEDAVAKKRIEDKKRFHFEPERESFPNIHVPTWLFWLKRAVDGDGVARVVKGNLPSEINGEPIVDFLRPKPKKDTTNDKLALVLEALLAKLK